MPRSFVSKKTIKSYQKNLDRLIDSLGREILVYVGSGVLSSNWDPYNQEPINPNEPITYDDTIYTVKAIVEWQDPNDYMFLPGGKLIPGDVKITCKIEDVLASGIDVNNNTIFDVSRKMIVDGQTVKQTRVSKKTGLRDLYIAEIWAERVDEE